MSDKILVVVVPWDKAKPVAKRVTNDLESLQAIVDGYMTVAKRIEDFVFMVNEEGDLRQLPYNRGLYVGDFFVAKTDADGEFVSMSEDESKRWIDFFDMEKRIKDVASR